jgi:C4-dicarboxylate transporter, DctM subunit
LYLNVTPLASAEVVLGTIPFHLIMFVVLAIVIAWPELSLWLPAQMSR